MLVSDVMLRMRFPSMRERPFELLCLIQHGAPGGIPPVLGLHNTLDHFRFKIDGEYMPQAPMGHIAFEWLR